MMEILAGPALKKMALAVAVVVPLLLIAACGGGTKEVMGLVLEAVERDLVEIELLRVRDDDGRVWEFSTEGPVGVSAAHLRQHQLAGEKVVVTYQEERGRLIAVDVRDAPVRGRYGR
ncbi:MAG: hypothetical protein IIA92_07890 [Chloroflexi bacterium]|nr:hypothetical protein [Chloroflexota bacterium]